MATSIFLALNGMGVVFLLYVLAKFRDDEQKSKNSGRKYSMEHLRSGLPNVLVVTHPISHNAQGGISVISIEARRRGLRDRQDDRTFAGDSDNFPAKASRSSIG